MRGLCWLVLHFQRFLHHCWFMTRQGMSQPRRRAPNGVDARTRGRCVKHMTSSLKETKHATGFCLSYGEVSLDPFARGVLRSVAKDPEYGIGVVERLLRICISDARLFFHLEFIVCLAQLICG